MKRLIIILLLIANQGFSQVNQSLEQLTILRSELNNHIRSLQDSLSKIDKEIEQIKIKEVIEKVSEARLVTTTRGTAQLRNEPGVLGDRIKTLNKSEIIILDYHKGYFGVQVGDVFGYLSEVWVNTNEEIEQFVKHKREEEEKEKQIVLAQKKEESEKLNEEMRAAAETKRQSYLKKYGKETMDKLMKGYVWIGMTTEMALISQGEPDRRIRSVGSWGVHEQWVYGLSKHLFFEN